uniref:Uncharacterized protein n=1 Tax=Pelagomonas calceolata TaxID=35677 RepID=A0A7S4A2M1_9STRA
MCSSSGEFAYEGHTLYCVEAAGEIHSVLPVFGQTTCRYTDENSCPDGFDIWVPRNYEHLQAVSYEHLRAVYDLAREEWRAFETMRPVGIYRDGDGCGSCLRDRAKL